MLHLSDSPSVIPGVGQVVLRKLHTLGIHTIRDLLFYFPFRYDRFTDLPFYELTEGEMTSIVGTLHSIDNVFTRNGKRFTKALFYSDGLLIPVIWFNQPYLVTSLRQGEQLQLRGKVGRFGGMNSLLSPTRSRVTHNDVSPQLSESSGDQTLIGVYSETAGLPSRKIRDLISYAWEHLEGTITEYLPKNVLEGRGLAGVHTCVHWLHFPQTMEDVSRARLRFSFEEVFISQLRTLILRSRWGSHTVPFQLSADLMRSAITDVQSKLPFSLTGAQERSLSDILNDFARVTPMNRLLEGDVGSGKTVVAALAMYGVHVCGFRSILMAPTQILATQHYVTIERLLSPFGVTVSLVVSGKKVDPHADIFVGTHALLHVKEQLDRVAFTIIDEQHRFGVEQRAQLRVMHGITHVLTMTATPIPRTLALTLYGDLDLSVIDEMPVGRKPVKTKVVSSENRVEAEQWIRAFIRQKQEQVFIVCPFVEPSETADTVRSAVNEFERLKKDVFTDFSVGLLHGKMRSTEKDDVLQDFRDKKYDILVCTPVVEVGIDIPNASIIVIESAERFGLAQLHQFRGRVGRGGQQAFCLLFTSSETQENSERLHALETTYSGIALAELDLKMRGSGQMFGKAQHGQEEFVFADLFDLSLISEARQSAEKILSENPSLDKYPYLSSVVFAGVGRIDAN